jgi:release factor glutamine methyltransferase
MTAPPKTWTILELLRWTAAYFKEKEVPEARTSAEVLLAHTLGLSRLDLYLRHDQPLTPDELARFKTLVKRRGTGEPVAYLTGHKEFWSLDFKVTPAVLVPRPETETLVEAVLEVMKDFGGGGQGAEPHLQSSPKPPPPTPYRGLGGELEGRVGELRSPSPPLNSKSWGLEVGTGSGALVVSLARELPGMTWVAADISAAALEVARQNARRHQVAERIHFLRSDLLSAIRPGARLALLVANLPYVTRTEWEKLPQGIFAFEPRVAIVGGEDGLDWLRPLAREAHNYLAPAGWLALEMDPGQTEPIKRILEETQAYDRLEVIQDYHHVERVVRARRAKM